MSSSIIETARLRLEPYASSHLDAIYAMDSNPQVARYVGDGMPKTRDLVAEAITRCEQRWNEFGFSWWAAFAKDSHTMVGAVCLQHTAADPNAELEIGWRLRPAMWGQGFATEAGRAAAEFAFSRIGADHVIAVANPENTASHRVMQRIGMRYRGIEMHYDQTCVTY